MTWGDVIDREKQEARDEGRAERLTEGQSIGELCKLSQIICKKLSRGITDPAVIADALEEPVENIASIMKQLEPYAPDYTLPEDFIITLPNT